MIQVEYISGERWLVTVAGNTTTQHTVSVKESDLRRLGGPPPTPEQLLRASFQFLLEREPNTSILSEFELPLIGRYFPEYEREIPRYLDADRQR